MSSSAALAALQPTRCDISPTPAVKHPHLQAATHVLHPRRTNLHRLSVTFFLHLHKMDYGLLRFVPGIQRHFFFQLRRDFGSSCGNQLILHAISREPRRMPRRLGTASLDFTVHWTSVSIRLAPMQWMTSQKPSKSFSAPTYPKCTEPHTCPYLNMNPCVSTSNSEVLVISDYI